MINLSKGVKAKYGSMLELENDKVVFTADSDAIITKGIVAVLIRVFHVSITGSYCEGGHFFYRRHRTERTFVPYPCQWFGFNDQANEIICPCLSNAIKKLIMSTTEIDTYRAGRKNRQRALKRFTTLKSP